MVRVLYSLKALLHYLFEQVQPGHLAESQLQRLVSQEVFNFLVRVDGFILFKFGEGVSAYRIIEIPLEDASRNEGVVIFTAGHQRDVATDLTS